MTVLSVPARFTSGAQAKRYVPKKECRHVQFSRYVTLRCCYAAWPCRTHCEEYVVSTCELTVVLPCNSNSTCRNCMTSVAGGNSPQDWTHTGCGLYVVRWRRLGPSSLSVHRRLPITKWILVYWSADTTADVPPSLAILLACLSSSFCLLCGRSP